MEKITRSISICKHHDRIIALVILYFLILHWSFKFNGICGTNSISTRRKITGNKSTLLYSKHASSFAKIYYPCYFLTRTYEILCVTWCCIPYYYLIRLFLLDLFHSSNIHASEWAIDRSIDPFFSHRNETFLNSLLIVQQKLKLPRANLRSSLQSSKKFHSRGGNFAVSSTLLGG